MPRGEAHGFCSPQRKRFLPGAQRAPGWKSAATAPRATGSPSAKHGASGARGREETPIRGAQLAGSARTDQQSFGSGESKFADGPETGGGFAKFESGPGGPLPADTPNF